MSNPPEIDKEQLYGRYQRPADARAAIDTDRLKWQNQLQKQLTHKALDEPIEEREEMQVNVRRGMGWPELTVCGSIVLALCGLIVYVVKTQDVAREPAPYNYVPPVHVPAEHVPQQRTEQHPHQHSDRDTLMIPRLRFGPDG